MMSDALWQDHQIAACAYHGGMSDTERAEVQLRWATNDSCKVLYCTVLYVLSSAWCCIMRLKGHSYKICRLSVYSVGYSLHCVCIYTYMTLLVYHIQLCEVGCCLYWHCNAVEVKHFLPGVDHTLMALQEIHFV